MSMSQERNYDWIVWPYILFYIIIGVVWYTLPGLPYKISIIDFSLPYVTLISGVLFWIYEIILLTLRTGLRSELEERMDNFNPEANLILLENKISVSSSTFSTLTSLSFSLIVFLLGFFIISEISIKTPTNITIVSLSLISLLISGIVGLIGLDEYDTAADPSYKAKDKWCMRKFAKNYFICCWYFLIFGVINALSLISPLLTLIGYFLYTFIHNIFWFAHK